MCGVTEFMQRLRKFALAALIVAGFMLVFSIAVQAVICIEYGRECSTDGNGDYSCKFKEPGYYEYCNGNYGGPGIGASVFGIVGGVLGLVSLGCLPNPGLTVVHCVFCVVNVLLDFGVMAGCIVGLALLQPASKFIAAIVLLIFLFFTGLLHFGISVVQTYYILTPARVIETVEKLKRAVSLV